MGEIVPHPWDWEHAYQEVKREIYSRYDYRRGGRPHPSPLDVAAVLEVLDRIEPELRKRAIPEITEQTMAAMDRIVDERISHRQGAKGVPRSGPASRRKLPKTPAERLLSELNELRRLARADPEHQDTAAARLKYKKWCQEYCPYPDACVSKRPSLGTYSAYGCLLRRLTFVIQAPWWKRLLGQRYQPTADQAGVLERIRKSRYYTKADEAGLKYFASGRYARDTRRMIAKQGRRRRWYGA